MSTIIPPSAFCYCATPPIKSKSLLPQIADGLGVTLEEIKQQIDAMRSMPKFQPVVIKPEASPSDIAFIESHRSDIPILEMLMVHRRRYPHGDMLANSIGYVGEVSAEQVEASDSSLKPGDIVGKAGLERQYNSTLMGTDGLRRVIVNSVGKEVGRLEQQDAIPGKPIQLTIDYDLQAIAEADLADKEGALVAMDARTGEILAMVSQPTFDPNDFAVRISPARMARLNTDPEKPLLNRAIQAQLAPGSDFKIVMSTAMLESKAIPADYTTYLRRPRELLRPNLSYVNRAAMAKSTCTKESSNSCDIYFYNVGKRLGIDRISQYATDLGLAARRASIFRVKSLVWFRPRSGVQRVYHHKWYPGSTISVSIGQGATMVTPIQLALNDRRRRQRRRTSISRTCSRDSPGLKPGYFPISDDTVRQVTDGMWGVVNEPDGTTSGLIKLQNIEFSGKTGTAQVDRASILQSKLGKKMKENGWFVGLAPRRDPEIVVAALVQAGGWGGTSAAPIVRDIVKAYYDKKNGAPSQLTGTGIPGEAMAERQSAASFQ